MIKDKADETLSAKSMTRIVTGLPRLRLATAPGRCSDPSPVPLASADERRDSGEGTIGVLMVKTLAEKGLRF
jgi:hypothetical protein